MSAYLTTAQAAAHLNLPSVAALHTLLWRRRKAGRPVTTHRLNGRLRFRVEDLDGALTVEKARATFRRIS